MGSTPDHTYSCDTIEVLEGLEPVRRRPGMYVGDVHDGTGLHHVLWEVVDNVVDLSVERRANHLRVDLSDGWVEVEDDGPGFPMGHTARGESALELLLGRLHLGSKPPRQPLEMGLRRSRPSVGLCVVNALSEELEIETRTAGSVFRQRYRQGRPVDPLTEVGKSDRTGTRIRFRPDPTIFENPALDENIVRARLRELAYLNPSLTIRFGDETSRERGGIAEWVHRIARERGADARHQVIAATAVKDGVLVEVAITWMRHDEADVRSFVSQYGTSEGGTHVEGLWAGLSTAFSAMPRLAGRAPSESVYREVLGQGLIAVVHVGLEHADYDDRRRQRLTSPEARDAVAAVVAERLRRPTIFDAELVRDVCARF